MQHVASTGIALVAGRTMSLFQYGFRRISSSENGETEQQSAVIPSHLPSVEESGLGRLEYAEVVANRVPDLADPSPAKRKRVSRGKYTVYTAESRAKIGKYALENGNKNAQIHFKSQFPDLKESTIRNFKKTYKEQLKRQLKLQHFQLCLEVGHHYSWSLIKSYCNF